MSTNTLEYQLSRVAFTFRNMGGQLLSECMPSILKKNKCTNVVHPESEALTFYLWNHATSIVRKGVNYKEPLLDKGYILEEYSKVINTATINMYYYLLLICTRESRHIRGVEHLNNLRYSYPHSIIDFTKSLKGLGSSGAVERFLNNDIQGATIGQYTEYLVKLFNGGTFTCGYGSKPWGTIAKVLNDFVEGRYTPELLLDTAFTLAHNNGPIFNKGLCYYHYDKTLIITILDVQRAGEVPNYIISEGSKSPDVCNKIIIDVLESCNHIKEILGIKHSSNFNGVVDWGKVDKYGVGNYKSLFTPDECSNDFSNFVDSGITTTEPVNSNTKFDIPSILSIPTYIQPR